MLSTLPLHLRLTSPLVETLPLASAEVSPAALETSLLLRVCISSAEVLFACLLFCVIYLFTGAGSLDIAWLELCVDHAGRTRCSSRLCVPHQGLGCARGRLTVPLSMRSTLRRKGCLFKLSCSEAVLVQVSCGGAPCPPRGHREQDLPRQHPAVVKPPSTPRLPRSEAWSALGGFGLCST